MKKKIISNFCINEISIKYLDFWLVSWKNLMNLMNSFHFWSFDFLQSLYINGKINYSFNILHFGCKFSVSRLSVFIIRTTSLRFTIASWSFFSASLFSSSGSVLKYKLFYYIYFVISYIKHCGGTPLSFYDSSSMLSVSTTRNSLHSRSIVFLYEPLIPLVCDSRTSYVFVTNTLS